MVVALLDNTMESSDEDNQLGEESDENSEMSDGELQEAFAKGLLKPGLNIPTDKPRKRVNNEAAIKQCLADFEKSSLPWVERLDMINLPAVDIVAKAEGKPDSEGSTEINADDDFRREMFFYRQAQAAVLEALPRLKKYKISTKRPEDYFAEMAKSDQQMQKIRKKLIAKQESLEKSEKAKKLREQRKFGKKVQVEVIQRRHKEKKAMMTAVKKYQKGMSDKLDFLEGDQKGAPKGAGSTPKGAPQKGAPQKGAKGSAQNSMNNKRGANAKRKFKDQKFGFGGKKSGKKWNTKESHDDVSGFRSKMAHGKGGKGAKGGKGGAKGSTKRPGKNARKKMKGRS